MLRVRLEKCICSRIFKTLPRVEKGCHQLRLIRSSNLRSPNSSVAHLGVLGSCFCTSRSKTELKMRTLALENYII